MSDEQPMVAPTGGRAAGEVRVGFGDVVVDLAARTIERDGVPVPTEPQVFDVLALLMRNRERVVTKSELLDEVWGDRFVSPATLTSRIRDLRAALGDSGRHQRVIKTAHGRGFRFVAPLRPFAGPAGDEGGPGWTLKPLIGRTDELAAIDRALGETRLLTLVGPGGVGKTHLMRHAIADRDVVLVELADVRDQPSLARSVLVAAGGTERPDVGPSDAAIDLLADRDAILVFDNCEHVIDEVVATTAEVLRRCPSVRVLATSRRPLHLAEELVVRVGPLADADAVELFVSHARRHGVDVSRQLDDPDTARELCSRLDRLPLALELAATKARAIPLTDLLGLLDDRFTALVASTDDAGGHHHSLEAAIAWSFELLRPSQQQLLLDLAAIVGDFDLDTARAVGSRDGSVALVADLMVLVDVSLVTFDAAIGSYGMLESIRMYAEQVGVDDAARGRVGDHLVAVAEAAGSLPVVSFADDVATIRRAWPGIRAVVGGALAEGDTSTVHRIVAATIRFAEQTFSFEVLDWALAAAELDGEGNRELPVTTSVAMALLLTHRGDFADAERHLVRTRSAEALVGDDASLLGLAVLWHCYFTGDLEGADQAAASIREQERRSDTYEEIVATIASQFLDDGAQRPFDPSAIARLDEWALTGDRGVQRGAELCAALRLDRQTSADVAVERLTEIVDDAERSGWAFLATGASTARSISIATAPQTQTSIRVLRAALRSYASVGSWQFALADFGAVALALVRHGRPGAAAELLGARAAAGYVGDASNDVAEQAVDEARAALGDRRYSDTTRHGSARDVKTATRLAIAALDEIVDTSSA